MQETRIEGTGFAGWYGIVVVECPAGADPETCRGGTHGWAYPELDTSFLLTAAVRRTVSSDATGNVDCASAPGTCEIVVYSMGIPILPDDAVDSDAIRVPLGFDPAGPRPDPPSITVTPHTDLLNGQVAAIEGAGFSRGAWIDLEQCTATRSECRYLEVASTTTDDAGAFSETVALKRRIPVWEGDPIDCAVDACEIVASTWADGTSQVARASVSFDPSVPVPPPPTLAVDPPAGLVDKQLVTVTGSGWTPGDAVYVQLCADIGGGNESCSFPERYLQVGTDGTFTQKLGVRRFFSFYVWGISEQRFDCASAPGACHIDAMNVDDMLEKAAVGLAFDPDAPPAPPPTIVVRPSTGLVDHQVVNVHGEGFLPGADLMLQQCVASSDLSDCRGYAYVTAADDGTIDAELEVRRLVGSMSGPPSDCAVDACVITAGTWWDFTEIATAALAFDPDAPFVRPVVTVTPNVGLEDAQKVSVLGSGFSPNASIGVAQCWGGAVSPSDCDLSTVVYTHADEKGAFVQEFAVRSYRRSGSSDSAGRDCIEPGACVIGAANLSDFGEAGRDWLTFGDPPVVDVGSAEVAEGDDGTTVAGVPVMLSEPSGAPVAVHYELIGGTAASPADFAAASGTLVIDAGATEATLEVAVVGDDLIEPDETLQVKLSDPVHAWLGEGAGLLTILDDDRDFGDVVNVVDDGRIVGAGSSTPRSGSSGGTLPFTGGGSQTPLGLGLVAAGAVALGAARLRRRRATA